MRRGKTFVIDVICSGAKVFIGIYDTIQRRFFFSLLIYIIIILYSFFSIVIIIVVHDMEALGTRVWACVQCTWMHFNLICCIQLFEHRTSNWIFFRGEKNEQDKFIYKCIAYIYDTMCIWSVAWRCIFLVGKSVLAAVCNGRSKIAAQKRWRWKHNRSRTHFAVRCASLISIIAINFPYYLEICSYTRSRQAFGVLNHLMKDITKHVLTHTRI